MEKSSWINVVSLGEEGLGEGAARENEDGGYLGEGDELGKCLAADEAGGTSEDDFYFWWPGGGREWGVYVLEW